MDEDISALSISIEDESIEKDNDYKQSNNSRPHSLSISWSKDSFCNIKRNHSPALDRWFKAVSKICRNEVCEEIYPWQNFPIETTKSEKAIRHRYSALRKKWVQDEIMIKLEMLPFDHGAMRECFRLKKLPNHKSPDWQFSSNYVAKRYIKEVKRDVYFEDVKLQMESKLWAEEFNRQNPPKKIDIFQLSVIELTERESKPLYHIEHFMDGSYRKYNSNSGFVDDTCLRNTPHAFSHFTFERSGHRMMVVDIQGVGDLYTDPQIHTADGLNYGDGNLGLRGMALFFSSHQCNAICEFLNLSQFDMHDSEIDKSTGIIETTKQFLNDDDFEEQEHDEYSCSISLVSANSGNQKRQRSISFKMPGTVVKEYSDESRARSRASGQEPMSPAFLDELFPAPLELIRAMSVDSGVLSEPIHQQGSAHFLFPQQPESNQINNAAASVTNHTLNYPNGMGSSIRGWNVRRRQRNYSDCSDLDIMTSNSNLNGLEDGSTNSSMNNIAGNCHSGIHWLRDQQHKPASAEHPTNLDEEVGHSILAQVHHEMARLHESGRIAFRDAQNKLAAGGGASDVHYHNFWAHLVDDEDSEGTNNRAYRINWQACLFHERQAAQLGCLEAVIMMARYGLNMGNHMLQECPEPPTAMDQECGVDYLWRAADSGDRRSMIELANRYCNDKIPSLSSPSDAANEERVLCGKVVLTVDWLEAVKWYRRAFEAANKQDGQVDARDAEGKYDSTDDLMQPQEILGAMARLYFEGGNGLEKDVKMAGDLYSEAAELATNAGKGRQAAKFYELADDAYMLLDDNGGE